MHTTKNISVFSFTLKVIKPFRFYLWGQIIIAMIWAIDLAMRPLLIKLILNRAGSILPEQAVAQLGPLVLLHWGIGFLLLFVLRLHDWCWLKTSAPLRQHIGLYAMDRMLDQSHYFYQNNFAGSLSNRVNDVIVHVPTLVKIFLDNFFSHGISVIFAVFTVLSVGGTFAIGMIFWVLSFVFISCFLSRHGARLADDAAEQKTTVIGAIVDVLMNIMNVRLFNGKSDEYGRLDKKFSDYVSLDQKMKWFYLVIYFLQGLSFAIFQGICFWWLIDGFSKGVITPGDFSLITTINLSIVGNLWYLSKDIKDFSESYGAVVQGLRSIEADIELQDAPDAQSLVVTGGEIVFEKVRFHYKGALPFFNDKSVVIPPGQKVGLVGPSGSGKSTFASLLLRMFELNSGRILIDGQDIAYVTQESLRNAIAMIPQETVLFHRTLMENIRYSKRSASDQEVIIAAQMACAHDFIMRQPEGYNMIVGERGGKLSGGQRQRIAIARAFLKKPKILILDEATSALDSITELEVQYALHRLMEHTTTIVIAHRLSTLEKMDRILVFDQGKIVEDGTHAQLLANQGLYANLWNAQVGGLLPAAENKNTN
jgi:ATP-binding cassette subfamily B protein